LTAVLAKVASSRAVTFAAWAGKKPRNTKYSKANSSVLPIPTNANRTRLPSNERSGSGNSARRVMWSTERRPVAKPRVSRAMPFTSAIAVHTMSTRESGSSTQSTGTSWIRIPERSAKVSNSVSKNHSLSSTRGNSSAARSARIALNPHWASLNRTCSKARSSRL